jgi:hypothetical protein
MGVIYAGLGVTAYASRGDDITGIVSGICIHSTCVQSELDGAYNEVLGHHCRSLDKNGTEKVLGGWGAEAHPQGQEASSCIAVHQVAVASVVAGAGYL